MNALKDKVVLITGGAKRIGKAIALQLANNQLKIALHYNNSEKDAKNTAEKIRKTGSDCMIIKADLRNIHDINAMVESIFKKYKKIDILINNAAVFYPIKYGKISEKQWNEFMDINLKAPLFCSQIVTNQMLKKNISGHIINIADEGIINTWKNYLPYSISKAGLTMLTGIMAKNLSNKINVNCFMPGKIIKNNRNDAIRLEYIAYAVEEILKSKKISGRIIPICCKIKH